MRKKFIITTLLIIAYGTTIPINLFLKNNFLTKKSPDIIQNIFGGFRDIVGSWSLMKGEEYYHRGLSFLKAEAFHAGGSALLGEMTHVEGEASHEHEGHGHGAQAANQSFFSKLYSSVRLTEDSHLAGEEEKEVLPWFYAAVIFDPNNITGYLLGGYWFERLKKPDEAIKFLEDGRKNNPLSAQIIGALGGMYYRQNKIDQAIECLERACSLWKEGKPPNVVSGEYTEGDRFFAFNLLGDIYEKNKNYTRALDIYNEFNAIAKPEPLISEKIRRLEKG